MSNILRFLIMGPPGSGKGTISSRIVRDFNFAYLACGDLLRSHIMRKTPQGIVAKSFMDKGNFVPDDVVRDLVFRELDEVSSKNLLLDGFPRTIQQAEDLKEKITVNSVIDLKVPDEVIIERLKGRWVHVSSGRIYHTEFNPPKKEGLDDVTGEPLVQRDDDMPDTVRARLQNYKTLTKPLQEYYRSHNLLHEFTGKNSNEIWSYVKPFLEKIMSQSS